MDAKKREITLPALVDSLGELPTDRFDMATVDGLLSGLSLCGASIKPYTHFLDRSYTRNLVFKNDLFEVLLLCWDRGQITPVHNHRGQLGWMMIHQGALSVVNYRRVACSGECTKERRWSMMMVDRVLGASTGALCHVQDGEQVHQIRNDALGSEPAISLHIYSRPITSCVVYDTRRNECSDRQLTNFTEYGQLVTPA